MDYIVILLCAAALAICLSLSDLTLPEPRATRWPPRS